MKRRKKLRRKFTLLLTLVLVGALVVVVGSASRAVRVSVNSETFNQDSIQTSKNFVNSSEEDTPISVDSLKKQESKTAILFTSSWCGSCSKLSEDLESYASQYVDISFYVVDLESNRDLATSLDVGLTPTLVLMEEEEKENYSEVRIEQMEEIITDFNRIGVR